MFDIKYMVDAAMKPRQLTSTGKMLKDQLLEQEKADLQWLYLNKPSPAKFSLRFHFAAHTKPSTVLCKASCSR